MKFVPLRRSNTRNDKFLGNVGEGGMEGRREGRREGKRREGMRKRREERRTNRKADGINGMDVGGKKKKTTISEKKTFFEGMEE